MIKFPSFSDYRIGKKVLLATLAIPIPPGRSSMEEYLSYNPVAYEKERKLSALLSWVNIPTRKILIAEVVRFILFLPASPKFFLILCFLTAFDFIFFNVTGKLDSSTCS